MENTSANMIKNQSAGTSEQAGALLNSTLQKALDEADKEAENVISGGSEGGGGGL